MMQQISMTEARDYFRQGFLKGAVILREPMGKGWYICVDGITSGVWALKTWRGDLRVFASLDSAANALREIGFAVNSFDLGTGD